MLHEHIDTEVVSSQAARQILDYWFNEYGPGDLAQKQNRRWFAGGDDVDPILGHALVIGSNWRLPAVLRIGKVRAKAGWP